MWLSLTFLVSFSTTIWVALELYKYTERVLRTETLLTFELRGGKFSRLGVRL